MRHPEMHSLVRFHSLGEFPQWRKVTRRAFLALRVIRLHGKSCSNGRVKKCKFWMQKWKFLRICEFVWLRSNFPAFIEAIARDWCGRWWDSIPWAKFRPTDRFAHAPQTWRFSRIFEFCWNRSGGIREASGAQKMFESAFRMVGKDLGCVLKGSRFARKLLENSDFSLRRVTVNAMQRTISGRRKALRVIPRGKRWLTVYRAHQVVAKMLGGFSENYFTKMTRKAF